MARQDSNPFAGVSFAQPNLETDPEKLNPYKGIVKSLGGIIQGYQDQAEQTKFSNFNKALTNFQREGNVDAIKGLVDYSTEFTDPKLREQALASATTGFDNTALNRFNQDLQKAQQTGDFTNLAVPIGIDPNKAQIASKSLMEAINRDKVGRIALGMEKARQSGDITKFDSLLPQIEQLEPAVAADLIAKHSAARNDVASNAAIRSALTSYENLGESPEDIAKLNNIFESNPDLNKIFTRTPEGILVPKPSGLPPKETEELQKQFAEEAKKANLSSSAVSGDALARQAYQRVFEQTKDHKLALAAATQVKAGIEFSDTALRSEELGKINAQRARVQDDFTQNLEQLTAKYKLDESFGKDEAKRLQGNASTTEADVWKKVESFEGGLSGSLFDNINEVKLFVSRALQGKSSGDDYLRKPTNFEVLTALDRASRENTFSTDKNLSERTFDINLRRLIKENDAKDSTLAQKGLKDNIDKYYAEVTALKRNRDTQLDSLKLPKRTNRDVIQALMQSLPSEGKSSVDTMDTTGLNVPKKGTIDLKGIINRAEAARPENVGIVRNAAVKLAPEAKELIPYLVANESSFITNAKSNKDARGLTQALPSTAMKPGYSVPDIFTIADSLKVSYKGKSEEEAERLLDNPEVNAAFGVSYLKGLARTFGKEELSDRMSDNALMRTLIGYNHSQNVAKQDKIVYNKLPEDTRAYIYNIFKAQGRQVPVAIQGQETTSGISPKRRAGALNDAAQKLKPTYPTATSYINTPQYGLYRGINKALRENGTNIPDDLFYDIATEVDSINPNLFSR